MKFFTTLLMLLIGAVCISAAPTNKNALPSTSRLSDSVLKRLQHLARGCNARVCFAIDGSSTLNADQFQAEIAFVQDVATIIADGTNAVELGAVQYGVSVSTITQLTLNPEDFILALSSTTQLQSPETLVVGGINSCFGQLISRRRREANKIVLLGTGESTIGERAVERANLFRRLGGEVCTVAAGTVIDNDAQLLEIAGAPERVFRVDDFLDVLDLEAILEDLVRGICRH